MEALRRSVGGAAAEKIPKKSAKRRRRAASGQKEMLMQSRQEAEGDDREEADGKAAAQIGLDAARVTAVTSVIEGRIREYPDQWLWLHRR